MQIGNGRLNYINGYVSKDHDAVDVGLGEYVQKDATSSWLAAYRLLCKGSPGLPEVAIRMAQLSEFERSYSHVLLYPPQPAAMVDFEGRQANFSTKMYGIYLEEKRQQTTTSTPVADSFLVWHRGREYDPATQSLVFRGGRSQQARSPTNVVACRYWYELTDGFWGQLTITQLPHLYAKDLLPKDCKYLVSMINFAGMLEYLGSWRWHSPQQVKAASDIVFEVAALPYLIDDEGGIQALAPYVEGGAVFASDRVAFEYILAVAKRELQYRGMRDDRLSSFEYKQEANFLLYLRVVQCQDDHEYELLRQRWDSVNRPKYRDFVWSPMQREALAKTEEGISYEDEEIKLKSHRFLYIEGPPGSGKSAVILEAALRAARAGHRVLIVCPTGLLVHQFKSALPEMDGVENISIDTIQGVLKYKRPGKDQKVHWAPPSALRRIDLILVDEASQYDDREWERFYESVREQPHAPYCAVVADFQQLQPVSAGILCKEFCARMVRVTLDTVYRSTDEEHLLFQNRIRHTQPSKPMLREYFEDRHWSTDSLQSRVAYGMRMAEDTGKPFTWLTCTNKGAAEVCLAALRTLDLSEAELENGYLCDPSTQSTLRIVARAGILLRLSRNLDKQRGFVTGAVAWYRSQQFSI